MFGMNCPEGVGNVVNQGRGKPWSSLTWRLGTTGRIKNIRREAVGKARVAVQANKSDPLSMKSELQRIKRQADNKVNCAAGRVVINMSRPVGSAKDFRTQVWRSKSGLLWG